MLVKKKRPKIFPLKDVGNPFIYYNIILATIFKVCHVDASILMNELKTIDDSALSPSQATFYMV